MSQNNPHFLRGIGKNLSGLGRLGDVTPVSYTHLNALESHEDEDGTDWEALFKDKEDVAVEKEEAIMGFQLTEEVEEKKEAKLLPLKETKKFTKKAPKPQK